eukprot:UN05694
MLIYKRMYYLDDKFNYSNLSSIWMYHFGDP